MMTTASYPTATPQASAPSTPYQQRPNAAEYGYEYGYGNGNGNYNYYPTTPANATATTTASSSIGYGSSGQQGTYNNNNHNPYPQTPQLFYANPNQLPAHAYGTVTNEAKAADGDTSDSKQKTKRRWSLYGRSKNEGNDGPESPTNATGAADHQHGFDNGANNGNDPKKDSPARRRWSLNMYGRSRNGSKDESDSGSEKKPADGAAKNQQLVAYGVPPSDTYGQKPPEPKPGFRPKELHPDRQAMKNDRKAKMAGAATTGAIIGGVLTGPAWPVGAMAGAAIATYAGKVTARAGERRQQRKWEQKTFNDYLAKGQAGVQSENVTFA